VEGSAPSEAEKGAAHRIRARDEGSSATQEVTVHHGKEKLGKPLDYGENLDRLAPYRGAARDEQT
jgi:hypothetical protein